MSHQVRYSKAISRPSKLKLEQCHFDRTLYVNQKVCSVLCFGMFNKCIRPDNIMILKFLRIEFLFLEQTRFLVLKMVLAWLTIQLSLYNLFDLLKLRITTLLTPPDMNITQTKSI